MLFLYAPAGLQFISCEEPEECCGTSEWVLKQHLKDLNDMQTLTRGDVHRTLKKS